jgi:hypothetical protein
MLPTIAIQPAPPLPSVAGGHPPTTPRASRSPPPPPSVPTRRPRPRAPAPPHQGRARSPRRWHWSACHPVEQQRPPAEASHPITRRKATSTCLLRWGRPRQGAALPARGTGARPPHTSRSPAWVGPTMNAVLTGQWCWSGAGPRAAARLRGGDLAPASEAREPPAGGPASLLGARLQQWV